MTKSARALTSALAFALSLAGAGCGKSNTPAENLPPAALDGNLAPVENTGAGQTSAGSSGYGAANRAATDQPPNQAVPYATDAQAAQVYAGDEGYAYGAPIYASEPPPPLPDYSQPPAPGPDYHWTPGYWSYGDGGYYWVPGDWVLAPFAGALWTPPWWAFIDDRYVLHHGYWARHVGYYGGTDYGFGYPGRGYYGGYWSGPNFVYNTAVNNVRPDVARYYYHREAPRIEGARRAGYFGGPGGATLRPSAAEAAVTREQRQPPIQAQLDRAQNAAANRQQFAAVNHGRPQITALRPGETTGRGQEARPQPGGAQQPPPSGRPENVQRPGMGNRPGPPNAPEGRPEVTARPEPGQPPAVRPEAGRGAPEARPEVTGPLNQRPIENRPAIEQRPAPAARPEAVRPETAARPPMMNRPEAAPRPAEIPRPQAAPLPRPQMEARPAPPTRPAPAPRPQMEARPAPAPQPQPAARPQMPARPAPAPGPPPQAAPRSAPPGPPATRPAPAGQRPEERR